MKSIKNIIMSAAIFAAAGFGFTSCDIDLLPLNQVVLENFWTNKDDVESVVASCYTAMQSEEYIKDMIVWGETRSDNVVAGTRIGEDSDLKYLMQGTIKTTSKYCDWTAMYVVINRCNTVLEYAPMVAEKDPNYTDSDLKINIAECKFLRAVSYFTLIKTFKDVPFTFKASIDDSQDYTLPQTKFEVILDALIADIESCKDYAPRRYSLDDTEKNTGRVTRAAMYALLSELYLWRGADVNLTPAQQNEYYKKCVECADFVIDYKIAQYDNGDYATDLRPVVDKEVYNEYGYPLLAEERTVGTNNKGPEATNAIFGEGASFETIFEIGFHFRGQNTGNGAVETLYGTSSDRNFVKASDKLMENVPATGATYSDNYLFTVPCDYRSLASYYYDATNGPAQIYKYVVQENRSGSNAENGSVGSKFTPATKGQNYSSSHSPNWIIYRLTEVMLFRAEAEIEMAYNLGGATPEEETPAADPDAAPSKGRRASIAVNGSSLNTPEELLNDAFKIISAVFRRSNPILKTASNFAPGQPSERDTYRTLLLNERRRELLFEGKRYYDLVRHSRRIGNTNDFRRALSNHFREAGAAVSIKMAQMDFMYMPVFRKEMKVNPNLVQNSCYLDESENLKN